LSRVVAAVAFPVAAALAVLVVLGPASAEPATYQDLVERVPEAILSERPPLTERITLVTPELARERRRRLVSLVFGRRELPARMPTVEVDVGDLGSDATEIRNLRRVDRVTVDLPKGFVSHAHHLVPVRANGRLLVYHGGHKQAFSDGRDTVAYFLGRGYAVLVFSMPLADERTYPKSLRTRVCGRVVFEPAFHETLACLKRPLRLFVEPVAVALNYTSRLGYERTDMLGFSGGGWTTVLYAALDTRVQQSYSVAGSLPLHVGARDCQPADTPLDCFGDYEQRMPALYRLANYPELYTLGAWGRGRSQLAIYNVDDPCCFSGRSYGEWAPDVQEALRRLGGGTFGAIGDTTHDAHALSPFALRAIEVDLSRAAGEE
jgi:hypothetical protein